MGVNLNKIEQTQSPSYFSTVSNKVGNFCGRAVTYFKTYNEAIAQGGSLVVNGFNFLLNSEYIVPFQGLLSIITFIVHTALGIKTNPSDSPKANAVLTNAKLLIGAAIPCALFSIYASGKALSKAQTYDEKEDLSLDFVENVGWLGDSIASFFRGLTTTGYLRAVAPAVFPLALGSAVLSGVSIFKNGKNLDKSRILLKEVRKKDTNEALDHIAKGDDYAVKTHFNAASGKDMKDTITKISTLSREILANKEVKEDEKESIKQKSSQFLKLLTDRIKSKNFTHRLAMLSMTVQLVGLAILAFVGAAALGYGLLAIGAMISLAKFFNEKKQHELFSKEFTAWGNNAEALFNVTSTN